jgi:PAT family beta-lactamase induction signal transducer AmpG
LEASPTRIPRPARLLGWLGLLYLSSGLPNGLVTGTAPTLYAAAGVKLGKVGLLALAELPWILKVLWAPALDRVGSRRAWVLGCQVALAATFAAFAALPSDSVPPAAWAALVVAAIASATQDVAIDAYSIDAVPPALVGPANSVRATSYRLSALAAVSLLVGFSDDLGWSGVWTLAAAAFVALAVASPFAPRAPRARPAQSHPFAAFPRLFSRPGFAAVALFAVLFKVGDYAMARMVKPCLLDHGFTKKELGLQVTILEASALIAGAGVGGWLTRRWGVFRALWILGLFQAGSNLVYAYAADHGKDWLWVAAGVEPFCGGLGTAPFLSFVMLSCEKQHAATHFATFTAIMGLGRVAVGSVSGYGVEAMGYGGWFAATFAMALPAFALLPAAGRWLARAQAGATSSDPE